MRRVTFRLTSEEKSGRGGRWPRRRAARRWPSGATCPTTPINGYLRALIRRDAKAADIAVDGVARQGSARTTAGRGSAPASPRRGSVRGK
jgi:hypothetical protein